MTKTIYTNKTTGEKLEFVSKEGQLYTLKNSNNEEIKIYRIVLAKHYDKSEEIIQEENNNEETENITTRKNVKHKEIKVMSPKGEEVVFGSIKEFSQFLENELCKKINKGHLYNLVNGKSKSYLGYKVAK